MLSNEVFDKVFTIVKQAVNDIEIKDSQGEFVQKWTDLKFARSLHELEDAELPCVLMIQIGAPQTGLDLMRNTMNAVDSTFQVESISSISYDEAYDLINDVGDVFIQLGYALTFGAQEIMTDQASLWRFVARFNRVVGADDTLAL